MAGQARELKASALLSLLPIPHDSPQFKLKNIEGFGDEVYIRLLSV